VLRRIGINYDTCHFALEFDSCHKSLNALRNSGLRISKIHLSSALEFDLSSEDALKKIQVFDEPTYLHQVIVKEEDGTITRFKDLPCFMESSEKAKLTLAAPAQGRIHFHIPLYAAPEAPLKSTNSHAIDALAYLKENPNFCSHFEIETYTWGVLPENLQVTIEDQIAQEYEWVKSSIG